MAVIERVIFWPVRAQFGRFERCRQKRVILWRKLNRFHLHFGSFRQRGSGRQNDDAIFNFSGYVHHYYLTDSALIWPLSHRDWAQKAGSTTRDFTRGKLFAIMPL